MNQAQYLDPTCPNCGERSLDWDEVDVGVGIMRSPARCYNQDCGYGEDTYVCEPDGRVPTQDVPTEAGVAEAWAQVPVPPTPNERQLEDDLHDAINPPVPGLNIGLARYGAKNQVARIMEVLRQRGLIQG